MNLTKLEKAVIIILVVGGILAAGIFFFIVPAYKGIETANKNLDSMKSQRQQIEEQLAREATIDDEIAKERKEAEAREGDFYPDLTTYEALEILLAHLKECDMLATDTVTVTPMTTDTLALSYFVPSEVIYDLKTYSQRAHGEDEGALLEGEFLDKNKRYSVTVYSLTDVEIRDVESGETVEKSKYTDTMKDAYKEAICRYAAENKSMQTIGATTVTFTIRGTYENYLKYLDYLFDIDRATYMETVVIPMTHQIEEDDGRTYVDEMGNVLSPGEASEGETPYEPSDIVEEQVQVILFSVEPMDALENIDAAGVSVVVNQ